MINFYWTAHKHPEADFTSNLFPSGKCIAGKHMIHLFYLFMMSQQTFSLSLTLVLTKMMYMLLIFQ